MLTKMMAVVVMVGALGVAGHSIVSEFGCPFTGGCCHSTPVRATPDCCSTQNTSDCCSLSRSACCAAECEEASGSENLFVYSETTGLVHLVQRTEDGYRCVHTGEVLGECCSIPLN